MKNELKKITSKEHFNKYSNYIKGIKEESLLNLVRGLYKDVKSLEELFLKDKHLNNINMEQIDSLNSVVRSLLIQNKTLETEKKEGRIYSWFSLSDGCSIIKHILIYRVLKVKPIFEEDIKDFEIFHKKWLEETNYKKYPNEDNFYRALNII
jgi:hypothetical protein